MKVFTLNCNSASICCIFFSNWRTRTQTIADSGCGRKAVYAFFLALQKQCGRYNARHPTLLGGDGVRVQIDESLFNHKRKNHTGRIPDHKLWVFGMIEGNLESHKIVLKHVEDRSAATLLPIIREHVRPLQVVVSDEWRAYCQVERDLGMGHLTVNHKMHFVDPNTGAHTQRIESLWAQLKGHCKEMRGMHRASFQGYLDEWMWRYNYARSDGNAIFTLIKLQ